MADIIHIVVVIVLAEIAVQRAKELYLDIQEFRLRRKVERRLQRDFGVFGTEQMRGG